MKTLFPFPMRLAAIAILLSLSACREQSPDPVIPQGRIPVRFSLTLPDPTPVQTRAQTDTDVDNIDLLVFDENNLFLERVAATGVTGTGTAKTFTAFLDASAQPRTVHLVANGRDAATNADRVNFSHIAPGMTTAAAIPALQTTPLTAATADSILPLAMWGRADLASISSSTAVSGLKLLRSQACIVLGTDTPNSANGLNNFTFTAFTLHNVAASGTIAPADYSGPLAIPAAPTVPPVPTVPNINYYTTQTTGHWAPSSSPAVYLYEHASTAANHPSLLIHASYNGQPGFYRVVMTNAAGRPLPIVRNHRYLVTIVKAYGAGYPTLAEALANAPSNALKLSIADDRNDIALIIADGQNELGISNNRAIIQGLNATLPLEIATAYMTRTATMAVYNHCPALASVSISLGADGLCRITAQGNGAVGTGTITVTDGSLQQQIAVEVRDFATGFGAATTTLYRAYPTFLTSANRPWHAEIAPGSEYVWLHNALAAPSYPGGAAPAWGFQHLSSANFGAAHLYLHQTQAVKGMVKYACVESGEQVVGRMIFNK